MKREELSTLLTLDGFRKRTGRERRPVEHGVLGASHTVSLTTAEPQGVPPCGRAPQLRLGVLLRLIGLND